MGVPADEIYGYPIFSWITVTRQRWEGARIVVPTMATRHHAPFQQLTLDSEATLSCWFKLSTLCSATFLAVSSSWSWLWTDDICSSRSRWRPLTSSLTLVMASKVASLARSSDCVWMKKKKRNSDKDSSEDQIQTHHHFEKWWHIYVSEKCVIVGSGNGLAPVGPHAITWINADLSSIVRYECDNNQVNSSIILIKRQKELELERLHSEDTPCRPWLPILLIHMGSQIIVKTRQSQSYKFKEFTKTSNFWILKKKIEVAW